MKTRETLIKIYYGRWEEMLGEAITGSVQILKKLINDPKFRVVALTNWSAETFPVALKRFDFLHWFEGIVVSGTEKTRKPYPEIYQITLDRFNIAPSETLFIDDNLRNIKGAEAIGINGIHFSTPEKLIIDLNNFKIKL